MKYTMKYTTPKLGIENEIYNPEAGHFSHPPLLEAACLSCPVLLKSAHKTQLLGELGPLAQSRMEDLARNQFMCRGPGAFTLCSLSTDRDVVP